MVLVVLNMRLARSRVMEGRENYYTTVKKTASYTPKTTFMKVIICLDYSAHTEKVLNATKLILGENAAKATIIVVHVIDTSILAAGIGNEEQVLEGLLENSRLVKNKALEILGDDMHYVEEYGTPRIKIDEALDGVNYDLLITGTKGKDVLERTLLGSTAEHLLHNTGKPILIVP
jgi:nucleotide-binding universal stress UspA family protein